MTQNHKAVVLWASARKNGNTSESVKCLTKNTNIKSICLNDYDIEPYQYDHAYTNDTFKDLVTEISKHNVIVFSTPVYWYAMNAQMKIFFDRMSDLITIDKKMGRALAGKSIYLMASGCEEVLPEGFEMPFERTGKYFDMMFNGTLYLYTGNDKTLKDKTWGDMNSFRRHILQNTKIPH